MKKFIIGMKKTPTVKEVTDTHINEFEKRDKNGKYKDELYNLGGVLNHLQNRDSSMPTRKDYVRAFGISSYVMCFQLHEINRIEQAIEYFNDRCTVQQIFDYIIQPGKNGEQIVSLYVNQAFSREVLKKNNTTDYHTNKCFEGFKAILGKRILDQSKLACKIFYNREEKREELKIENNIYREKTIKTTKGA